MKRKIIISSIVISAIAILSSCTNPYGGVNRLYKGIIKGDLAGNGEPVPVKGIQVSSSFGRTTTNEDGYFEIIEAYRHGQESSQLILSDIDGEKNGSFASKSIKIQSYLSSTDYHTDLETIILERK